MEVSMSDIDLTSRLHATLEELKSVMESRRDRIEEIRKEIEDIEAENDHLENLVQEQMRAF